MNTLNTPALHQATHQTLMKARTSKMRELAPHECAAVSGAMPAALLLGAGIAAFGIGVIADNYYDGPMAGWWYRATN